MGAGVDRASRAAILSLWRAAIAAVDPERLVASALSVSRGEVAIACGRRRITVPRGSLWVAGAGKAAVAMARAVARRVPGVEGMVIAPRSARAPRSIGAIRVLAGEHPVPGRGSFASTRALVRALQSRPPDACVLVLLSGGASALLAMPAPGIAARDKVRLNRILLRAGMPIADMNALRASVSAVKGGGLLRLAAPRQVVTLVLSDVVGDDPRTIGSGPTVAGVRPLRAARRALARHLSGVAVPRAVRARLATPARAGREGAPSLPSARRALAIVGSNRTALDAAARRARALGFAVRREQAPLAGPARRAGERLAARLTVRVRRPTVLLAGGETVVDARGARGRGGRSQELALAAAAGLSGTAWTLLAAGSDGIDGATPAAGAFADGGTLARSGPEAVRRALVEHDSHGYFRRHGGLLVTGPTGTNVMDLVIALHPGRPASPRPAAEAAGSARRSARRVVGPGRG